MPASLHAARVMGPETLEHLLSRRVWTAVCEGLVAPLTQPFVDSGLFAIQCTQRGSHHLAGRRIGAGLNASFDAVMQFAQGHADWTIGARHAGSYVTLSY